MKTKLVASIFVWLLLAAAGVAQQPSTLAVIRIPSHGCSATVIATRQGQTYILGCAHGWQVGWQMGARGWAYEDNLYKPMAFDIPVGGAGVARQVGSKLLAYDYKADLTLVLLNDGPLPYYAPVAPIGWRPQHLLSCGYDEMQLPGTGPIRQWATVVDVGGGVTYTRENPVPGRSGGGLIDSDYAYLYGTCIGFELDYKRRGMYTSLASIQSFLQVKGYGWLISQGQPQTYRPQIQSPPPHGDPYWAFPPFNGTPMPDNHWQPRQIPPTHQPQLQWNPSPACPPGG